MVADGAAAELFELLELFELAGGGTFAETGLLGDKFWIWLAEPVILLVSSGLPASWPTGDEDCNVTFGACMLWP
ncbi:hypothetical protein GCM10009193_18930 [Shewanella aestuarii]|nr:hypothetical protein GCM10009193_18930 [Shewanella aestuarii]